MSTDKSDISNDDIEAKVETSPLHDETQDEALISLEEMESSSVECLPGLNDFVDLNDPRVPELPKEWTEGFSEEDVAELLRLSQLSKEDMIKEMKNIQDEAFRLGTMEAKEMSRGRYLGIFDQLEITDDIEDKK